MSDFSSVFPATQPLDPNKRVNYLHGLVLGVDEFRQEEYYVLEKDRQHNRTLHGYGTVCGLSVEQSAETAGTEIRVKPGMAINYCGQVIQVARTQCAVLEEWLAANSADIIERLGSPAEGPLSLFLMLCYRECETDLVPIPAGPCQSLEEITAASRIADDFSLRFSLDLPPDYHFEATMTELSDLLLSIPVEAGGTLTLEELLDLVRTLDPDYQVSSPPEVSSPSLSSPAIAGAIAPENVALYFREAFKLWVTEIKPCHMSCTYNVVPEDKTRNCVFLAQINFEVTSVDNLVLLDSEVVIDESQRQFLLATQDQQDFIQYFAVWAKSLASGLLPDFIGGGGGGGGIDDDNLVHIDDNETINGIKSFSGPLALVESGRVFKKLVLPGYSAHFEGGTERVLFNELPSLHFMTSGPNAFDGAALFSLPLPEDMEYAEGMQFRLHWGFQGDPQPAAIAFTWRVGGRIYQANEATAAFENVEVAVAEPTTRRNAVLMTPFIDLDPSIAFTDNHQYGALRISMVNPGNPISQVYLLQVDLRYTANRLGRGV
jgi:hypothetical protein